MVTDHITLISNIYILAAQLQVAPLVVRRIITASGETLATFAEELNVQCIDTLCETHYQTMYREVHKFHLYAGCGAKPKVREGSYRRHSPNAAIVSE